MRRISKKEHLKESVVLILFLFSIVITLFLSFYLFFLL